MTDSDDDYSMRMTRREALAGGSAAAVAVGAALYSDALVTRAKALSAGDARIVMGDQGESPAQNGEITHNSGDVEIYSGGAVRNLTDPTFQSLAADQITVNEIGGSGVSNSKQSVSSGSTVQIELDTTGFENPNIINVDTANDKLVVQKAGVYNIQGGLAFASTTGDGTRIRAEIQINGSRIDQSDVIEGGGSTFPGRSVGDIKHLSVNDEITLHVFQDTGSSQDIVNAEDTSLAAALEG